MSRAHAGTLRLNNQPRFQEREGRYFRLVQPYQYHSLIPKSFVYCWSFALHPEDPQPSGSCNFSRIDTVELGINILSYWFFAFVSNMWYS